MHMTVSGGPVRKKLAIASITDEKRSGSPSTTGLMSHMRIPGRGKSGTSRMAAVTRAARSSFIVLSYTPPIYGALT